VLLAAPAAAAPSVDGLTVRPPYFSPDGDGRADTTEVGFVPGGAADSVGVRIDVYRVAGDVLVDTPRPLAAAPAGVEIRQGWDPGPIEEGAYRFDVVVVDGADSLAASAIAVVDTTAPVASLGPVAPNPFDPASEPPADRLRVPFSVASDSTTATVLRVRDAAGASVDSLGTLLGPGAGEVTWDGLASSGAPSPTGVYSVRAISTDLAGNADTTAQAFTLDRDEPALAGVPDTLQTVTLPVAIAGTATDFDRVVAVETSVDGGLAWTPVDVMSPPGPSVSWSTSLALPDTAPGFYAIRARARDALDHVSEESGVVAFDHVIPAPIESVVLGDGTVADGALLRIRTEWTLPDLLVSVNLSPLDFEWSAGEETTTEGPPGTYLIEYLVSPANVRRAETKQIVIRASTGIVAGLDTVAVELVDRGPHGDEAVAVSRNRFDPESGESVTLVAARSGASVRVRIANLAGHVVRDLSGVGWVEWDGRAADGGVCASGVYFLRVEVDGEVEVRRVAVLRGSGP
jgi:hypothetical protein